MEGGGRILFLSRNSGKYPFHQDQIPSQWSKYQGGQDFFFRKNIVGKTQIKEKAEEKNQKLKIYCLCCWALKFHKYFIFVFHLNTHSRNKNHSSTDTSFTIDSLVSNFSFDGRPRYPIIASISIYSSSFSSCWYSWSVFASNN